MAPPHLRVLPLLPEPDQPEVRRYAHAMEAFLSMPPGTDTAAWAKVLVAVFRQDTPATSRMLGTRAVARFGVAVCLSALSARSMQEAPPDLGALKDVQAFVELDGGRRRAVKKRVEAVASTPPAKGLVPLVARLLSLAALSEQDDYNATALVTEAITRVTDARGVAAVHAALGVLMQAEGGPTVTPSRHPLPSSPIPALPSTSAVNLPSPAARP